MSPPTSREFLDVGDFARLDLGRGLRTGIPEIVLAEGKSDAHLREIVAAFTREGGRVLVSRLAPERLPLVEACGAPVRYEERARLAVAGAGRARRTGGTVVILAGGTADVPVCEEARVVAQELGCEVQTAYDVGVAGLRRLFGALPLLEGADAVVVAAGREGTLPAIVAGLSPAPVIGLPVSVGYGVGGGGQAALYSMLQSCAPLTLVNVDAGVVAGACAAQIANRAALARRRAAPAPEAVP
ncbi:MAG TPA: nickel pincer cofactor biosynthesis protein LarB [Candidatus Thermoplasmatota archaeon]|nr:nickel pincer cofactor biosynthesis protein LarB [Candidatus Thermoplasmatota archaeon]